LNYARVSVLLISRRPHIRQAVPRSRGAIWREPLAATSLARFTLADAVPDGRSRLVRPVTGVNVFRRDCNFQQNFPATLALVRDKIGTPWRKTSPPCPPPHGCQPHRRGPHSTMSKRDMVLTRRDYLTTQRPRTRRVGIIRNAEPCRRPAAVCARAAVAERKSVRAVAARDRGDPRHVRRIVPLCGSGSRRLTLGHRRPRAHLGRADRARRNSRALGLHLAKDGPAGGEFIYSEPGYTPWSTAVRPAGGVVVGVPLDDKLRNDLAPSPPR